MTPGRKRPAGPPPSAGVLARYAQACAREVGVAEGRVRAWIAHMMVPGTMSELPTSVARRGPPWLVPVLAVATYSVLAVLLTFPLVLHLSSRLPKDLGDPMLAASILAWNARAMPLTQDWWNGFGFFPAHGMMAFSAHLLGASLFATPLQWLGSSPVTAYNMVFLGSFPLSGAAAYALGYTLTRRHDAAFVCGLAYAFNPYRVGHVEHLELLLAFGMPMSLASLHRYVETKRVVWLAVLGASLAVQALCTSYYALFFSVFAALWVLWFIRLFAWRDALTLAAAGLSAVLIVSPVALGYGRVHESYNWRRDFHEEVLRFSADISALVTASPLSSLWGWTGLLNGAERQIFPGLTVLVLVVVGVVFAVRRSPTRDQRICFVSKVAWLLAGVFALVAAGARALGPWRADLGLLTVSVNAPYKPLSVSVVLALCGVALLPSMRAAFRRRSVLAFYVFAAIFLYACSLGPQPTLLGERVFYQPPYAWLMNLPFFGDTVRVPARFAMLGMLALAASASLVVARWRPATAARRGALLAAISVGLAADGWMTGMPQPEVPHALFPLPAHRPTAVLELPLGDVISDSAALYRATLHGIRAVNGYNGFEPVYYQALRRALNERDPTVLDSLASSGPIQIAVSKRAPRREQWQAFLTARPGVRKLRDLGRWDLYWLPRSEAPPAPLRCLPGPTLEVMTVRDASGPIRGRVLVDGDPATRWMTDRPQRAGDRLVLDLGTPRRVCRVGLSMGSTAVYYPSVLRLSTSSDGARWTDEFVGRVGGQAVSAALRDPKNARITIPLTGRKARYVSLTVDESHPRYPWAVAGISLEGHQDDGREGNGMMSPHTELMSAGGTARRWPALGSMRVEMLSAQTSGVSRPARPAAEQPPW